MQRCHNVKSVVSSYLSIMLLHFLNVERPEHLNLEMCNFHIQFQPGNPSSPFLPSEVHAWGHTVRQKGLPCVRDRLGNPPSWVAPPWQLHYHHLVRPSEPSSPALPVSAGRQEVHTTEDVLCNPSHDHTRPWEQVCDTYSHIKTPTSLLLGPRQFSG